MKTRIVVHIAFNSSGYQVAHAIDALGRFLSVEGGVGHSFFLYRQMNPFHWKKLYSSGESLIEWKERVKRKLKAVRFHRVIVDGEAL